MTQRDARMPITLRLRDLPVARVGPSSGRNLLIIWTRPGTAASSFCSLTHSAPAAT